MRVELFEGNEEDEKIEEREERNISVLLQQSSSLLVRLELHSNIFVSIKAIQLNNPNTTFILGYYHTSHDFSFNTEIY